MGLTLEVLDGVEPKDVEDTLAALSLGVIRDETVGGALSSNEILESFGHIRFKTHGIDMGLGAVLANIELSHSSTCMPEDSIIVSRSVTEESVGSNCLIPAMHIIGRETGLVVFSHRKADRGASELGSGSNRLLNAVNRHPTEEGS